MEEYKCSFKVNNLEPYFKYLEINGYAFNETKKETRIIFKNENGTAARISIDESRGLKVKKLEFKGVSSNESLPIFFEASDTIKSVLNVLEYQKDSCMIKTKFSYSKNGITIKLDDFEKPEKMGLVTILGDQEIVDELYYDIKDLN